MPPQVLQYLVDELLRDPGGVLLVELRLPVAMTAGAELEPALPWRDRAAGLVVHPYVIVGATLCAAAGLLATRTLDLRLWCVLAATVAGWSAAWSP